MYTLTTRFAETTHPTRAALQSALLHLPPVAEVTITGDTMPRFDGLVISARSMLPPTCHVCHGEGYTLIDGDVVPCDVCDTWEELAAEADRSIADAADEAYDLRAIAAWHARQDEEQSAWDRANDHPF